MKENTGYICNWQKCGGCNDCFILSVLLVFVAITIPVVGWGSFACPIAFLVKFLYGQFLDGTRCRRKADSVDCIERTHFFFGSFLIFVGFHLVEYFIDCCEKKENYLNMKTPKVLLKIGQLITGASFVFTFLPWFINDFLQYTYLWIRVAIVVFTAAFWFFVPVLRKYSSLVILIYAYSYVVYWHLYKGELFNIKYTEERFRNGMIASMVMLAIFSVLGDVPLRLVHIYNRLVCSYTVGSNFSDRGGTFSQSVYSTKLSIIALHEMLSGHFYKWSTTTLLKMCLDTRRMFDQMRSWIL